MKCLYIDCGMGAAGDMLNAALYELLDDAQRKLYLEKMNALGPEDISVRAETVARCGIQGTHMAVLVHGEEEVSEDVHEHEHAHEHEHHHEGHDHAHEHEHHHDDHHHDHDHGHDHHHHDYHHHASMRDVSEIISALPLSDNVKQHTLAVYNLIADAEAHAHGVPVTDIHFHEVGTKDAVADVAGVCLLLEMLAPDEIVASPVHVGSGKVRCAHGILPVPAPATAHILKGVPVYGGEIQGELCTPTGAALLKHFVNRFDALPKMTVDAIGYGMGKKEFKGVVNCLRVMCGEMFESGDFVIEFVTNTDDMTPEETGFATEMLFEAGALEVYTQTVFMKKNRPGLLLNVMCREADKDRVLRALFRHTTTIGVREYKSMRHVLTRESETIETDSGPVRKKTSKGFGVTRSKYEFDDLARIAREKDISLREARQRIS